MKIQEKVGKRSPIKENFLSFNVSSKTKSAEKRKDREMALHVSGNSLFLYLITT